MSDTKIETDEVTITQSRPWPEGCTHGIVSRKGFTEHPERYGFIAEHGPDSYWLTDPAWYLRNDRGDHVVPRPGHRLFGLWRTEDAACDAAWRAAEDVEVDVDLATQVAARHSAADLDVALAEQRARQLHQCGACWATWRGERQPALVLRPGDRVEVQGEGDAVVFTGAASAWGPELSAAVTAAAHREILKLRGQLAEMEGEAAHHRTIAGIRRSRIRCLGVVLALLVVALFVARGT